MDSYDTMSNYALTNEGMFVGGLIVVLFVLLLIVVWVGVRHSFTNASPAAVDADGAPADETGADTAKGDKLEVLDGNPVELTEPQEIANLLRMVRDKKPALTLFYLPDHSVNAVTRVLDAGSQTGPLILVDLDDVETTKKLVGTQGPVLFSTSVDQVYLTFETEGVWEGEHLGRPVLKSNLPKQVIYMQRRDSFRINVPPVKMVYCIVDVTDKQGRLTAKMDVRDISTNGVALADPKRLLDTKTGTVYEAVLHIPRLGDFEVKLNVVHYNDDSPGKGGGRVRRLGCAFLGMPETTRIRIESFITTLQHEEIMRKKGLT